MSEPYMQIRRTKVDVGPARGECIAIVDEDFVKRALELFTEHDPSYSYWAEPYNEQKHAA